MRMCRPNRPKFYINLNFILNLILVNFGALNRNPTSELVHHLRLLRYPNLKVQKTRFIAIFGVKLYRELMFVLKTRYGI